MYRHANYLSHYRLYKNFHDFNVELEIGKELIRAIEFNYHDYTTPTIPCDLFFEQINRAVSTIERRFQLICAQSILVVEFDLGSRHEKLDHQKERLTEYFNQYAERTHSILLFFTPELTKNFNNAKNSMCNEFIKNKLENTDASHALFNEQVDRFYSKIRQVMFDFMFKALEVLTSSAFGITNILVC